VPATRLASAELVASAWIATIPGFTADGVSSQLPADETTWAANGYVVVPVTVGGSPHPTVPMQRPVLQVECWATNIASTRLPWGKASNLAEQIRIATYDRSGAFARLLNLEGGYPPARVTSARVLTHPQRIWADTGDYAGFRLNLELQFTAAGEVIK
jgi:hypothetical protein